MADNHKETLGPPFAGNGWSKIRTFPMAEFSSAVRLDAATGDMVLQLGVLPHPQTSQTITADLIAGFQRNFRAIADGYYTFRVRWEPGAITVRNHGAVVSTTGCFLSNEVADFPRLTSSVNVERAYTKYLFKDTDRLLTFGARITIQFTADQTAYAEILARAAFLEVEYPPVLAAKSLPPSESFVPFELGKVTRVLVDSVEDAKKQGLAEL
ncbi:MAG TPA: hypothetical protein VMU84_06210 [Thermoanaerobaculia bacterium]|nr:hypothetical protein [Thermoanaerobaculia bacterium]